MDVEFWYDFSSPWTYLASTQVERVVAGAGATLHWRPMLLGAVFKQVGTPNLPAAAMPERKRNYYGRELHTWAQHWSVPFRFTTRFPMRTVLPLRSVLLAAEDRVASLSHAYFRALWVDDRDISDEGEVASILSAQGLDAKDLMRRAGEPEGKQKLLDATTAALEAGVFGAPTFIVKDPSGRAEGDELLWGQDRFELLERMLGGWRPKRD